jgi:thiol-disulfide isomerase/thioredoxin
VLIAIAVVSGTALVGSSIVVATFAGSAGHGSGAAASPYAGPGRGPPAPSKHWVEAQLAGSPAMLAGLHRQGGALKAIPLESALHRLRGYPVVVNAWASWCGACRTELPLLARQAARFGTRVAFVGADVNDSAAAARELASGEHLSYPSYVTSATALRDLVPLIGFPTTIYIDRRGHVVHSHQGEYSNGAEIAADVRRYALGAGSVATSG